MTNKVISANRVLVKFAGKMVGIVSSLDMRDSFNPEPIYGIGEAEPFENVVTRVAYHLSAVSVALLGNNLRAAGIAYENASDALRGRTFEVEVYSKDTNRLFRKYTGVSISDQDVSIRGNQVISQNVSMVATGCRGRSL